MSRARRHSLVTGALFTLLLCAIGAGAEIEVGIYAGLSETGDTDVRLSVPGGTEVEFGGVSWDGESFTGPIYYGLKLTHWLRGSRNWGIMGDFTHAKMVAQLEETVPVSGTRNGIPVSSDEVLGDTFDVLSFTHGYNLFTINGVYRWRGATTDNPAGRRVQPYLGLGLGIAVPHTEVYIEGSETYEYQYVGPAGQGLVGLAISLSPHWSLFGEYKLSYAEMDAALEGGGSLRLEPWTHHLLGGVSFRF